MTHGHGHSHGLIDPSIRRSRAGLRAVGWSLAVLGVTALAQAGIYLATGSVALLADLIHNASDALTALPVGLAFLLRSARAERWAGLAVVGAIFASACVAGVLAVEKVIDPKAPDHLLALAIAGIAGFAGNEAAAQVRLRAGRRLDSPALIADGNHARTDGIVSLGVVLSAALVAIGIPIADPLIAIVITVIILRITWQSWRTVRDHDHHAPRPAEVTEGEPDTAPELPRCRRQIPSAHRKPSRSATPARISSIPSGQRSGSSYWNSGGHSSGKSRDAAVRSATLKDVPTR
jgi:Co/Zn/Cd efflux system component